MVKRALLIAFLTLAAIPLTIAETPMDAGSVAVPAGTMLHCRTQQTLTTKINTRGDKFTLTVSEPVTVDGRVAIPVDSVLSGRVAMVERPGRVTGVGRMRLTVEQITLPDGRTFPLSANLMTAYGVNDVKVVGSEGTVKGPSSRGKDMAAIGAGGAGGTLVGLIFGHPGIGAAVGFTTMTLDRMRRRGKDLTIPIGTQLNYELSRELAISNDPTRTTATVQVPPARE